MLLAAPVESDVAYVAAHMRAADRLECLDLFDLEPRAALDQSLAASAWALSAFSRGRLIAIVGVAREHMLSTVGIPWMLAVDGVESHGRAFALCTAPLIARMLAEYPRLENVVHTENHTSIAWLRRAGFQFGEPAPFGTRGARALRFWKHAVRDCGPSECGTSSVRRLF